MALGDHHANDRARHYRTDQMDISMIAVFDNE
jgi:hypothetical protein